MPRASGRRLAVALIFGGVISLLLAVAWYIWVARWYVESMRPLVDWLFARLSLGRWRVELVLLHLANGIPFVALALVQVLLYQRSRRVVFYCLAGIAVIVVGHVLLSVYMAYLHLHMTRSPLFAYLLIIGFSIHDLLPFAIWVNMARPEWLARLVKTPAGP